MNLEELGLQRLQILVEIVDSGGFGTAARRLNLTQPAISFHIRALESTFGTPLFEEPRRAVKLTETGTRVYLFAQLVLREARSLCRDIKSLQEGERGRIVFGASTSMVAGPLPRAVAQFQKRHPEVEVVLRVRSSMELCQQVMNGDLDAAIVLAAGAPPELEATPVGLQRLHFVAPPDHPLLAMDVVPPEAVSQLPVVLAPKESVHSALVRQWYQAHGIEGPNVVAEIQSLEGLITAVEAGLGISVTFEASLEKALALGTVKCLPVADSPITTMSVIVQRRGVAANPLLERFCSFVVRTLA